MVAAFLPVTGVESTWDERGGNSNAVRNTELMMECNDCLFEGWNEQTVTTHIEMWSDQSEVEIHFVRVGHILDKLEGDKMPIQRQAKVMEAAFISSIHGP
jgi:hypothetical protein